MPLSTQGRISIAGVVLNALGVFVLFLFRLETPGGYVDAIRELVARNRRRMPWRCLGFVLLWGGVVVQALAQCFP